MNNRIYIWQIYSRRKAIIQFFNSIILVINYLLINGSSIHFQLVCNQLCWKYIFITCQYSLHSLQSISLTKKCVNLMCNYDIPHVNNTLSHSCLFIVHTILAIFSSSLLALLDFSKKGLTLLQNCYPFNTNKLFFTSPLYNHFVYTVYSSIILRLLIVSDDSSVSSSLHSLCIYYSPPYSIHIIHMQYHNHPCINSFTRNYSSIFISTCSDSKTRTISFTSSTSQSTPFCSTPSQQNYSSSNH